MPQTPHHNKINKEVLLKTILEFKRFREISPELKVAEKNANVLIGAIFRYKSIERRLFILL
jgi:hypothetical protein